MIMRVPFGGSRSDLIKGLLLWLLAGSPTIVFLLYMTSDYGGSVPAGSGSILWIRFIIGFILMVIATSVFLGIAKTHLEALSDQGAGSSKEWGGRHLDSQQLLRSQDEFIQDYLKGNEVRKVYKNVGRAENKGTKIILFGFNQSLSKYYLSVADVRTPSEVLEKQHYLSFELMSKALTSETGLLISDVVDNT